MADIDFPEDLIAAERDRQAAWRRLAEIPLKPWTDGAGTEHGGGTGWTPEHERQEDVLRERLRELSATTATHPYWQTLDGMDRINARAALKQAAAAEPAS